MGPSHELQLPKIQVKAIRPHLDIIFTKLTAEEWRLLELGAPNKKTEFQLAELIMTMTATVSSKLLATLGKEGMSVTIEKVKSSLRDALFQSFTLVPGSSSNSETLDEFTELVAEEVTERVNASLRSYSTSTQSSPPRCHQITAENLEEMLSCLCRVLNESAWDIKGIFKPRGSRSTVRSSDSGKSEAVHEMIMKEVRDIIEPLVDEISESELSGLISESSLEFKAAADEIYQIISKEESTKPSDSRRGSKFSKSPKRFWKGVGQKIKKLLAKLFATASMLKMGTQVRKKFCKKTQVQSSESVKSLMDSVESLLLTETKIRVSPANAPVLSDVLYRYITYDTMASPVEVKKVSVRKSHRKMYADIKERMINFLPLMNWWSSKQAGDYTKKVTSALMEVESEIVTAKEREESGKKTYVRSLIDELVTQVNAKSKVNLPFGETKEITQNLFEKTWAEVQHIEFDMSPKIIDKLHKAVFKDLCKIWGCPEMLLVSIRLKEPEVAKRIAACLKSLMSKKPASTFCSCFGRFFKR